MRFTMQLECPSRLSRLELSTEPAEDPISLAIDGCALLGRAGCRFKVGGFGDEAWPVDVPYDLSTVIQQLADFLSSLRSNSPATLEFFGQGVERVVDAIPVGHEVELSCRSGSRWNPDPSHLVMPLVELDRIMVDLAKAFASALQIVGPGLASSPDIAGWADGKVGR